MWTSDAFLTTARLVAMACAGLCMSVVVSALASVTPVAPPELGVRGRRRVQARSNSGFARVEPLMGMVAGWVRPYLGERARCALARVIRLAGDPAGLGAEELVALCVLGCVGGAAQSAFMVRGLGMSVWWGPGMVVLGLVLPLHRVRHQGVERAHQLERSLPNAMDLCVLCMSAGCDFPAALRFVVEEMEAAHQACREELSAVLDELALGRTRVEALQALGDRTLSDAVREFVAAVCQSEQRGTPLVDALSIQATTLRRRRSVRAEEAAAKAAVKMMFPMLLMVASLLLLIFGPFIVRGVGL